MSLRDEVRAFLREHPDVLDDLRSGDVSKQYVGRTHLHRFSSESADNVARQITYVMREFDGGQTPNDGAHAGHDRVADVKPPEWDITDYTTHPHHLDTADEGSDGWRHDPSEEEYTFRIAGHTFDTDDGTVWDWVTWYVHDGFGVTQRQVTRMSDQVHGVPLTKDFARKIFRVLGITKDAPPYPPHVLQKYSPDEAAKLHFSRLQAAAELGLRRTEAKEYKKLWKQELEKSLRVKDLIEELDVTMPDAEWRIDVRRVRPPSSNAAPCIPIILLTDWHVGKLVDLERNQYTEDIFRRRVDRLLAEIEEEWEVCSRPIDHVQIAFAGDMCDGVSGDMHGGQAAHQWAHGHDQIRIAATTMARTVRHIREALDARTVVHSIAGNHDRVTAHRDDDWQLIAGAAAYDWAADKLSGLVEWTHHEGIVAEWDAYDTRILMIHGHAKPRNLRDLVWTHRTNRHDHYLVLSGHLHSLKIEGVADDTGVQYVRGPSLVGTDEYSAQQIGKGTRPAQVMCEVREDGPRPARYFVCE
jgi:hypothetical protein